MSASQAPTVDRIRFIGRPDDFLDRTVGNSGEIFYDTQSQTLRLYSGKLVGGYTVLTATNINTELHKTGVAAIEFVVTVGTDPDGIELGNKYFLNGDYKPEITLVAGLTYIFNQDDPTNEYFPNPIGGESNIHPINLSADNQDGELGGGTTYTDVVYKLDHDIVDKQRYIDRFGLASQRSVQITVKSSTPSTLYYWCSQHLGMGNTITTSLPNVGVLASPGGSSGEANQNAFSAVAVAGQTDINSTTTTDTITFVGGTNITLTTDAVTKALTISATGGGSSTFDSLTEISAAGISVNDIYQSATTIFKIGSVGTQYYTFAPHYNFSATSALANGFNPIYVISGLTFAFDLDGLASHPFIILDGAGNEVTEGIIHVDSSGNVTTGSSVFPNDTSGKNSGVIYWTIPESLQAGIGGDPVYTYKCTSHVVMFGYIYVKRLSTL